MKQNSKKILRFSKKKKEKNKQYLVLLIIGLIIFETIRNYIGNIFTILIFFIMIMWLFRNNMPEKFNSYMDILGLEKLKSPKDLNNKKFKCK